MPLLFQGTALALSSEGLAAVAGSLGVHAPEIWAVLAVETKGCGYLPDRRPQILYERHIFHRLTRGQFDDGDISDRSPGGYGPTGPHQYERLAAAIEKDRAAALQSVSWGLGQIMGENFVAAGFQNVEDMVTACRNPKMRNSWPWVIFLPPANFGLRYKPTTGPHLRVATTAPILLLTATTCA